MRISGIPEVSSDKNRFQTSDPSIEVKPFCIVCRITVQKMFKCKTCLEKYRIGSYYCSRECQLQDWEEHKIFHKSLIATTQSKAAYFEKNGFRFYLRIATRWIKAGELLSDENTIALTEAENLNMGLPGMLKKKTCKPSSGYCRYGPFPAASEEETFGYSGDPDDLHISRLQSRLNSLPKVRLQICYFAFLFPERYLLQEFFKKFEASMK